MFNTDELRNEFFGPIGGMVTSRPRSLPQEIEAHQDDIRGKLRTLKSICERLELYPVLVTKPQELSAVVIIEKCLQRFHLVARQLRKRYDGRETLDVKDEYDVQNLLHSLLQLFFDDIRPEEWTPSYAGKASRMDFILKPEQTVIETKMTRERLGSKQIGDHLLIDIGRYQTHTDCKTLVCFVYDPDGYINNPYGLESDLSKSVNGMVVKVFVYPK